MTLRYCTKESPMPRDRESVGDRWCHVDAKEVGEQDNGWPGGDIITVKCPHCGHRWREELPQ